MPCAVLQCHHICMFSKQMPVFFQSAYGVHCFHKNNHQIHRAQPFCISQRRRIKYLFSIRFPYPDTVPIDFIYLFWSISTNQTSLYRDRYPPNKEPMAPAPSIVIFITSSPFKTDCNFGIDCNFILSPFYF